MNYELVLMPETAVSTLDLHTRSQTGALANEAAASQVFALYASGKAANTLLRQRRDLELLADYLRQKPGFAAVTAETLSRSPAAWQGLSFGLVQGFLAWQLQQGFAVASINIRLSTVKTYARLCLQAGTLSASDQALIQTVKGYSRKEALHVDEKRPLSRTGWKKAQATMLTDEQARQLKTAVGETPQAKRDALLMCLLLDHGLRASEVAGLMVADFDSERGELHFYRPKTAVTTTHKLTADTLRAVQVYWGSYPGEASEQPAAKALLISQRALKDGSGGELLPGQGMSRIVVSQRVATLGERLGITSLSAHDCRHYCATVMARRSYSVRELCDWFGWNSPAMALRYIASAEVQERYKG